MCRDEDRRCYFCQDKERRILGSNEGGLCLLLNDVLLQLNKVSCDVIVTCLYLENLISQTGQRSGSKIMVTE